MEYQGDIKLKVLKIVPEYKDIIFCEMENTLLMTQATFIVDFENHEFVEISDVILDAIEDDDLDELCWDDTISHLDVAKENIDPSGSSGK